MFRHMLTLSLAVLLVVTVAACRPGALTVDRNADGSVNVSVALTQQDVDGIVVNALANSANNLLSDLSVDLQPGQIVATGTHVTQNGESVPGALTLTLEARDGAIFAQVTSVNIAGVDGSDARIAQINERLSADFARRAARSDNVSVESVSITDDAVTFVFRARGQS